MIEYGLSLVETGNDDFVSNRSAWAPILDMQYNAGVRAGGFAYEMIEVDGEAVACIPDGGLWEVCMLPGRAALADKSRRLAEVRDALETIPREHKETLAATYVEFGPRSAESAARAMQIHRDEFFDRLARALEWMELKLCIPKRKAA